jgi:hypothetical protein
VLRKGGIDFIGSYPMAELRVEKNKYPEPIGH